MTPARLRASITAIIDDIEQLRAALGDRLVRDDSDREAREIVQRIERRLRRKRKSDVTQGLTPGRAD